MKNFRILITSLFAVGIIIAFAGASCQKEGSSKINAASLVEDSLYLGNADAKVTIVEFSDFLCPACRMAHEVIAPVLKEYDASELRFVHKDFLIHGSELAIASRCVQHQGEDFYWDYYHYLFDNYGIVLPENVLAKTKDFFNGTEGFNYSAFESCFNNQESESLVQADHDQGVGIGVDSTPTFILNNRVIKGAPSSADQFRQTINELLAE